MVLLDPMIHSSAITFYSHNLTYLKRIMRRKQEEEEEEKGKMRRQKGLIFSKILKKVLEG